MNGQHTYHEIMTQPDAWAEALTAFTAAAPHLTVRWQTLSPAQVIFTGCGSTHYLALSAAAMFQQLTGVPARACPASELLLFGQTIVTDPAHTLLVAISRSGTTTETLAAVSQFRQSKGRGVWVITCYPESPLARMADMVLPAVAGQEQSVAQTRSFASMLLLAQALAAHISGQDWTVLHELPAYGRDLLRHTEPSSQQLAGRAELTRFTFLGSGPHYGVASEAMLKMTEMSLTAAQAFHFLEYRHGPMSMISGETALIGLLSPTDVGLPAAAHERQLMADMAAKGATILSLASEDGDILLPGHLPTWAYPVLYLPPLQLLAYHRAAAKGLDPDNPRYLTAVVTLDTAVF